MSKNNVPPVRWKRLCWPICALALSGCASSGKGVSVPVCPVLPPPPPSVMQPGQSEMRLRRLLFGSDARPMPLSGLIQGIPDDD